MRDFLRKSKLWIIIWIAPLVLFFHDGKQINFFDRVLFFFKTIINFAPFLALYVFFQNWYKDNEMFATAICCALILNLVVGIYYHFNRGEFSFEELLKKTIMILFVTLVTYMLLYSLVIVLDDSYLSNVFKNSVEFLTILFPTSKALKNIFILTDGKHPPAFIMKALYNFEKDGKLKDFVNAMSGQMQEENKITEEEEEIKE